MEVAVKVENFLNLTPFFTTEMFQKPENGNFFCLGKKGVEMASSATKNEKQLKYFPYAVANSTEKAYLSCLGGNPSKTIGSKTATRGKEKSPEVKRSLEKLKTLYESSNRKLFSMIGTTFPWS